MYIIKKDILVAYEVGGGKEGFEVKYKSTLLPKINSSFDYQNIYMYYQINNDVYCESFKPLICCISEMDLSTFHFLDCLLSNFGGIRMKTLNWSVNSIHPGHRLHGQVWPQTAWMCMLAWLFIGTKFNHF